MTTMPNDRAAALLARMTLEEKAQQLTGVLPFGLLAQGEPSDEQLAEGLALGIGHVSMFSQFGHLEPAGLARAVNRIQRYLVEHTRLGIPAMFHLEALNGLVAPGFTAFPTAIALAATWDPDRVQSMARILAEQMRAVGYAHALSPVMDVARDPRWGRVHETYGEDPYLVSAMSVAFTRGLQGDDLRTGAIATGKHFLGFGMTEGGQHMAATAVAGRELREVYARPFEAAIREAGLGSVMNSYSTIDGIPVGASRAILTDLLRGELGFTGTVVTDYGTIANLVDRQQVAADLMDAGRIALEAGLDVELPDAKAYGPTLVDAVRQGIVAEELVDRSVLRVLTDKFRVGLFDEPFVPEAEAAIQTTAQRGKELAAELARESITLLRDDEAILPISPTVRRIAVIGPHADALDTAFPGYTYYAALAMMAGAASGEKSNMAGTEDAAAALGSGVAEVIGAQLGPVLAGGLDGYLRDRYDAESLTDAIRAVAPDVEVVSVAGCGILDSEPSDIGAAVHAAENADLVVLALGGRPGWFGTKLTEGEGSDRADIGLPRTQVDLARALADTGTPLIGVVFTGRPFAIGELAELLPTIVYPSYGGQAGMRALAELLFGQIEPSGRLPLTIPRHSGQYPLHHGQHTGSGYRRTSADAHTGYTDMPSTPLFAFGHGLAYTTFEYGDLELNPAEIPTSGSVVATATVTNTGDRPGTEVVQFYASHRARLVTRPAQELVGFTRLDLAPGETARVEIVVSTGQLAYLGQQGGFVFEPGTLELSVGSSSADIRSSSTVAVIGPAADWSVNRPLFAQVRKR